MRESSLGHLQYLQLRRISLSLEKIVLTHFIQAT